MASLTDKAPKFDGSEEVTYWLSSMKRYFKRCQIEDSHLQREVLIGSLQGVAKEWFNALTFVEFDQDDIEDICEAINIRFGTTRIQKLKKFDALKQKSSKTATAFADAIRKTAIGLDKHPEDLVYKFLTSLSASAAIMDDIVNLRPQNL